MNSISYSRTVPHPVTLLSVSDGENENIATMSWVSAVSRKPALLMVSVSPKRFSHDLVIRAGEFAILVLSDSQRELATLAGTATGAESNKWKIDVFRESRKEGLHIKAPVLENCVAIIECKLVNHISAGDHTLMIGEVIHKETNLDLAPLILFNHNYYGLGSLIKKYP